MPSAIGRPDEDPAARLGTLFDPHHPRLFWLARRLARRPEDAHDLVQETFLRCWRRKDDIRADGFKALLFRTALNLASNRRRRARLWRVVGVEVLDEVADESVAPHAFSKTMRDALDGLPAEWRDVLLLTELAGMTYPEIAAALGIAEGTVGSRRTRALAMLRERLDVQGVVSHEY